MPIRSIELFAGAGGLALGMSEGGVTHQAIVEINRHACQTIRHNQRLGVEPLVHWPAPFEGDVRSFDFTPYVNSELVTGGPPCQPFSMGGKHQAFLDERDMFPQAIRAIREIQPKAFVIENVRGLVRKTFQAYFSYILLQMSYPLLVSQPGEEWEVHHERIKLHRDAGIAPEYIVEWKLINAADYGVPQQRWRVIFVGCRADQGVRFKFPKPSHSQDALLSSQWVTGKYWEEHGIDLGIVQMPPKSQLNRIIKLRENRELVEDFQRWRTVRDAICDLPSPTSKAGIEIQSHKFQPGARTYAGHTGSPLDLPAKALKAGDHGVPGGENMLRFDDGSVRYFTVRESARLQTFPDCIQFNGSWGESMRQLGNAVPVMLAATVAKELINQLGLVP